MLNLKKVISVLFLVAIISGLTMGSFAYAKINVYAGNLTVTQRVDLHDAIDIWNGYYSPYLRFATNAPKVAPAFDSTCVITYQRNPRATWAGKVVNGDIYINTYLCTTRQAQMIVIAHELGHVMGFGHFGTGIMSSELSPSIWSVGTLEYDTVAANYAKYNSYTDKGLVGIGQTATDGPGRLSKS